METPKEKIDTTLDVVGEFPDVGKVKSLIQAGESKTVEFKETLSLNVKNTTNEKDKKMESSVIKTIGAFLNTDGGVLAIGVHDASNIVGLEKEIQTFHENQDKLLLHFKNLIQARIGEQFYPYIDQRLMVVDGKTILVVQCKPSQSEVFVDGADFYVRTNPATDKLEGAKMVEYIKNRFKVNQPVQVVLTRTKAFEKLLENIILRLNKIKADPHKDHEKVNDVLYDIQPALVQTLKDGSRYGVELMRKGIDLTDGLDGAIDRCVNELSSLKQTCTETILNPFNPDDLLKFYK